MSPAIGILGLFLGFVIIIVLAIALAPVIKAVVKGIVAFIVHIATFVGGMIGDVFRFIGAVLTSILYVPLVLGSVIIGRWSAASHFGKGLTGEIGVASRCVYRVFVGHPARLLLLTGLTEGIEQRLADRIAHAPGPDKPSKRTGLFNGYTIVGSLKGGGSGGKLYVAEPDDERRAMFERRGITDVDQVVIKSFSLEDGSSLPQIIRESRALEAARDLGLVLEHEHSDNRFYYVMPYVPGSPLNEVTHELHAAGGAEGLGATQLRAGLGHVADTLETLERYHSGGLWHKDVKPDNIIVNDTGAHIVDLGLVTPLRSAMTLTTHGTEYFRDPEIVRQALRGAKVHEVDGVKFDIYGAGAVLYSVIENSFPAHGAVSRVSKRCPEAIRWIIRRAMTDLHQRYGSAAEMLADVRAVQHADDPFAMKPKDLPSMGGAAAVMDDDAEPTAAGPAGAGASVDTNPMREPADEAFARWQREQDARAAAEPKAARRKPAIRVTDWITGRYAVQQEPGVAAAAGSTRRGAPVPPRPAPQAPRYAEAVGQRQQRSAQEQLQSARARVEAARRRAVERRRGRRPSPRYSNKPNTGVVLALVAFFALVGLGVLAAVGVLTFTASSERIEFARAGNADRPAVYLGNAQSPTRMVPAAAAPSAPAAPGFDAAPRRVLVLLDPDAGWGDAANTEASPAMARVDALVQRLRNAGHEVLEPGDPAADAALPALISVVGVRHPSEPGMAERVRRWLNDQHDVLEPESFDAVLWAARPTDPDAREPFVRLVTRAGVDPASLVRARAAGAARSAVEPELLRFIETVRSPEELIDRLDLSPEEQRAALRRMAEALEQAAEALEESRDDPEQRQHDEVWDADGEDARDL